MRSTAARDQRIALVQAALHLARKLETHRFGDPRIAPLTPVERLVIQYIERNPGASLGTVAARVNLKPSNASAAVRRLVDLGLVERVRGATDARQITLSLTDEGRANVIRVHNEWAQLLAGAVVSDQDLETARRVLASLDTWLAEA